MPAGDGTGPMGAGPMTGRGVGYCVGSQTPGYMNPRPGRGVGMGMGRGAGMGRGRARGRGRGRGRRRNWFLPGSRDADEYDTPPYNAVLSDEQTAQTLRAQVQHLEGTLNAIKERISELEGAPGRDSQ